MAYFNATSVPTAPGPLRRIAAAIGGGLALWANIGPMHDAVRRLNAMSDADLAMRGTTRAAEVHRIFGPRSLL